MSSFFSGNTKLQKKTLLQQHVGKRILIKAVDIYGSKKKVPTGEEGYLFLYRITAINDDCKTAIIEYEHKAIKEDAEDFWSYADPDEHELDNYRLDHFKEDHLLFNKFNGNVNAKRANAKEDARKKEEEEKTNHLVDVTDIDRKVLQEKIRPYDVLVNEFEPAGPLIEYISTGKDTAGKKTFKQEWSE